MEDVTFTVGLNAEDVKDKAKEVQQSVEDIFSGLSGKELSPAIAKAVNKLKELNDGITETMTVMRELETTSAIPNEEYENSRRSVEGFKEALAEALARKKELEAAGQTDTSEYSGLKHTIASITGTILTTEESLKRMAREGRAFTFVSEEAAARYEELKEDLAQSVTDITKLVRQAESFKGIPIPTTFLETLQVALPRLALAFQRVGPAAMQALGNGIQKAVDMAKSSVITLAKTVASIPLQPLIAAKDGIISLGHSLANLGKTVLSIPVNVLVTAKNALAGVSQAIFRLPANIIDGVVAGIQKLGRAIVSLPHTIFSIIASKVQALARSLATLPINMLKAAANAAKELAKNLTRAAGAGIKRGVSGLASAILGIKRSSDSTNDSVKRGIKLFIKYAFGVRSFFFLYRKIRKAITEGFGDMAQVSAPLNNQLSQLATSMLYLRNAVTSAFAPIASFVIPILTTLINVLAAAANAVGQFMAALFGQTSFVKAKKVYKDYAASLDKGAAKQQKNASKTQKKVDKLQKTIAGFDDVNILESKDDDKTPAGGGGGGGAGAGGGMPWQDPSNMFETTDIEAKYKKLAEKIKGFFKKGDWEGLGKFIADGINTGFRAIDKVLTSTKVQERLSYIVNAITRTFNSLVKNIDWPLIGKTFGDGINLIVKTLNQLYTGIQWYSLGASIAKGLNSLVTTIDWTAIGNLFANKFNAIINLAYGVILNFDWANLGKSFGKAINGFFLKVQWNTLARTLANLVSGLFSGIQNIIDTVDWRGISVKLTQSLNSFIRGVNWKNVGKTLSSLIMTALKFIETAIDNFDWIKLGTSIGNFLVGIDWGGIILKVIQVALKAFLGLATVLLAGLDAILTSIFNSVSKTVEGLGKNVAQGLYNGISAVFKKISSWVKTNIFTPFINAVKKIFGISSPAKTMQGPGKDITNGLLKGITDGLKNIGSWVKTNVFNKVKSAFTSAFNITGGVAKNILSVGQSVTTAIKNGVENKWSDLKTKVAGLPKRIKDAFDKATGMADNLAHMGRQVISKMREGIEARWDGKDSLKSKITGLPGRIKDAFDKNIGSNFKDIGSSIVSGIKSGITGAWDSFKSWVGKKAAELPDPVKKALNINSPSKVFRDVIGKSIPEGIAVGIDKGFPMAVQSLDNMANGLVAAATDAVQLPPIVGGQVIPYSIGKADAEEANTTLNQVLDMLKYNKDNAISIEEIQSVFTELFRRYMNVQLYLGDEQVARHANAGNAKLNRRYNTT